MGTPQGVSESRWKWLDTPGVSLAGRPTMTETMRAMTSAASTNDDVPMVSSPTPEEPATAREVVRAVRARRGFVRRHRRRVL